MTDPAYFLRVGQSGALVKGTAGNVLTIQADGSVRGMPGGGGGAVSSVFGRAGAVVAVAGDYTSSQVTNSSGVAGGTVTAALNALAAVSGVVSVFGRSGAVVAAANDYTVQQVTGGWQPAADAAARLAIPAGNRQVGMVVYQVDTDHSWRLVGGVANGNYVDITIDGSLYSLVDGTRAFTGAVTAPQIKLGTGTQPNAGALRLGFGMAITAGLQTGLAGSKNMLASGLNGAVQDCVVGDDTNSVTQVRGAALSLFAASFEVMRWVGSTITQVRTPELRFASNIGSNPIYGMEDQTVAATNGKTVVYTSQKGGSGNSNGGDVQVVAALGQGTGVSGEVYLSSTAGTKRLRANDTGLGLYTAAPVAQQTVTGSRGGNAALADLLTKLATLGAIVDGTS